MGVRKLWRLQVVMRVEENLFVALVLHELLLTIRTELIDRIDDSFVNLRTLIPHFVIKVILWFKNIKEISEYDVAKTNF